MNIIFTVDVEGHVGGNPVGHLIYGITEHSGRCGIELIMDLLDEYKIRGLFFVDIAEAWEYGSDVIADVLRCIDERQHDVGVHIHPDHMADPKRMFLSEYSKEEQFKIIKKCTDFYEEILGRKPVAFRAGKYGANWDTLDILAQLGYKADFSQFFGQKWCHIKPPCTCIRRTVLKNGLMEIPVTAYRSFDTKVYSRVDKIDVGQLFSEFRQVMNILLNGNYCDTIVLFAHSFSMMDWRRMPNAPVFNKSKYQKLKKQLEYVINDRRCNVRCLNELIGAEEDTMNSTNQDILPILKGISSWGYLGYRAWTVMQSRLDILFRK